ncbi:MAG: hypothetical protein ACI4QV_06630, partial [Acutalibacteraceae bacterium]
SSVISQADADFCISNGISVFNLSGNGEIVRLVTTETETDGRVDYSFSDISTVLAFDDVVRSVRDRLTEFISSSETNSVSYCAIESLIIMLFEEKTDSKIISGYEKPVISTDENDPSVCNILLRFSIAHGISRINVQADIGL